MTTSLERSGFGETFGALVSRLRSDYSARRKSARLTSGFVSSSSAWPTARVFDSEAGPDPNRTQRGESASPSLVTAAALWPTPMARDSKGVDFVQQDYGNCRPLNEVAVHWRTPSASESTRGNAADWTPSVKAGEHSLTRQAATWNTPIVGDAGEKVTAATKRDGLLQQVAQWKTPRGHEVGDYQYQNGDKANPVLTLTGQASSHPARPSSTAGEPCSTDGPSSRRQLNARFVEWLMGWPPGWTSFECSEMAWCRYRALLRSELSRTASPPAAPPPQLDLFG